MLFLPQHALHFSTGHKQQRVLLKNNLIIQLILCSMPFVFYPNILCKGMQAHILNVFVCCRIV